MKQIIFLGISCLLIFSSCSPKISTQVIKSYSPLDYRQEVRVFGLSEQVPLNSEEIGTVKIGDTGFSTNCGWEVVIDKAKGEARKAGGNAIKIIDHVPPSMMGSSCHRIKAQILKIDNFDKIPAQVVDSALLNADYALLHVYRRSGVGALVAYDLHLGDTVICRVKNKWKKTIRIRKDGLNTLWARTEAKEELPVNIKFGKEYYVRCGVTMGLFVGHPKLELVDDELGKSEYQFIKINKSEKRDIVVLNDNKEIEGKITGEDNDNVYITIFRDRQEIKTNINKSQIKSIQKSE